MTVPKVFLSGYAKLPDNTTAQKLYNHLVLVVTAESSTGTILDADCTMATELGRRFIRELLVGYALPRGPAPSEIPSAYPWHCEQPGQSPPGEEPPPIPS